MTDEKIIELDKQFYHFSQILERWESKIDLLDVKLNEVVSDRLVEKGQLSFLKGLLGLIGGCLLGLVGVGYSFYTSTIENDKSHTASFADTRKNQEVIERRQDDFDRRLNLVELQVKKDAGNPVH
ncbi:MAG: hypothetical protein E6R13_08145 [Spirochaetes bacterium]|nr:MAG: hypothetical protein E6R13_08145 [Spirochaetota bacterium]